MPRPPISPQLAAVLQSADDDLGDVLDKLALAQEAGADGLVGCACKAVSLAQGLLRLAQKEGDDDV